MENWIRKGEKPVLGEITSAGVTYLAFPALEETGLSFFQ